MHASYLNHKMGVRCGCSTCETNTNPLTANAQPNPNHACPKGPTPGGGTDPDRAQPDHRRDARGIRRAREAINQATGERFETLVYPGDAYVNLSDFIVRLTDITPTLLRAEGIPLHAALTATGGSE